jgi:4-amino-4-deoxy-L-arabinose transferase-like glycosyltransferase
MSRLPVKYLDHALLKKPFMPWLIAVISLSMIGAIALFVNLGSISVIDKTEPMFVEAARQMLVRGDWITPYWNEATRFDKPPLVYWLMAIAMQIFGVNEWSARLPSAISAIALVFLLFYTLRYFGINPAESKTENQQQLWLTAGIGGMIGLLNPAWIAWGRTAVSDMLLASNIGLALLTFFIAYTKPQKKSQKYWYYACAVFIALAVLAKGPVGLVLPVLVIGSFLIYVGQWRPVLKEMPLITGSLIFLAIALPWFILVTIANGEAYIETFFGHHNVERFTSVVSDHAGPWFYYIPVIFIALLPWSVYLPGAIAQVKFWQKRYWQKLDRTQHLGLFAFFWLTAIFLFFSISVTKLPSYLLPAIPAGVILITLYLRSMIISKNPLNNRGFMISAGLNIIILLGLAIASLLSPQLVGKDTPNFKIWLAASHYPLQAAIIWLIASAIALFCLLKTPRRRWLWLSNFMGFSLFITLIGLPVAQLLDQDRQIPVKQLSLLVPQVQQTGEEFIAVGFLKPSIVFYSQRPVKFISHAYKVHNNLLESVNFSNTVLLFTNQKNIQQLNLQPNDFQLLGQQNDYFLVRINRQVLLGKASQVQKD